MRAIPVGYVSAIGGVGAIARQQSVAEYTGFHLSRYIQPSKSNLFVPLLMTIFS